MDDFYSSISEDCYVHKPSKKKKKAKPNPEIKNAEFYLNIVDEKLAEISQKFHEDDLQEKIKAYVESCNFSRQHLNTLLLMKGTNVSDHLKLFGTFVDYVIENISNYVVNLDTTINKTFKAIVKSIYRQLDPCSSKYENMDSLIDLPNVFQQLEIDTPLFICFQDLESSNYDIVNKLIKSFYALSTKVKIILVFGVSTTADSALERLSSDSAYYLKPARLTFTPSIYLMSKAFTEIALSPEIPIRLGRKPAQFLYTRFRDSDLSSYNYFQCFKFIIMEHFRTSPYAELCCPFDSYEKYLQNSGYSDEKLRSILCSEKTNPVLKSVRTTLLDNVEKLHRNDQIIIFFVKFLTSLMQFLPGSPVSSHSFSVYCDLVDGKFTKGDEYRQLKVLIQTLPIENLSRVVENLKHFIPQFLLDENPWVEKILKRLENILNNEDTEMFDLDDSNRDIVKENECCLKQKVMRREDLKAKLQSGLRKAKTPYEQIRDEFRENFHLLLEENLKDACSLPYSEIFYYNENSVLKERFAISQRLLISSALQKPGEYLKCRCCAGVDYPSSTLPNTATMYLLHAEYQLTQISICQWLQSFVQVKTGESFNSLKEKGGKKKIDEKLYASFIQAVCNLQFVGYVKSNKRKSDYVQKLTWGAM